MWLWGRNQPRWSPGGGRWQAAPPVSTPRPPQTHSRGLGGPVTALGAPAHLLATSLVGCFRPSVYLGRAARGALVGLACEGKGLTH